ncbi:MAG: choice-of-anchor R domain-containing protein [Candidatus Hodarchaeota archaeon]
MSFKARIHKKRLIIKCYFFISLLMLGLLPYTSFLQIIADSQSNYDFKDNEGTTKGTMHEIETHNLKNYQSSDKMSSDQKNKATGNIEINYPPGKVNDLNSIDRSRRSPPTSNGISKAGFEIQEYVVANNSQLNISTSNTWGDQTAQQNLTHIATYDLKTPTNKSGTTFQFIPNKSSFNITDVVATRDLFPIENKTTGISTEKSTKWSPVAQNFTVPSRMKLFSVWLYIEGGPQGPDMNVTICQDDSGHPGTVLAFEIIMDITISLSWFQVNFSSPPILSANTTFWIVLSHTDTEGFLRWGYQTNPGIPDYGGMLYYDTDWVGPNPWSLPLIIQVCRIDGSNQPLTYSTPATCGMNYGGGNLESFTNIPMNTTAGINDQVFQTTVAVIFNVTWRAKYQSQATHQVLSLEYFVSDEAAFAEWNITFVSSGVNSSYSLSNYNLTWTLVPTDWAMGTLFQGTIDVTAELNPTNNDRAWSIVNRSVLTGMANFSEITYRLEATSPNYVNHVIVSHLTRNLTQNLNLTTSFNSSIQPNDASKFNVSILFPNGTEKIVNSSIIQTTISQDTSVPLLSDYPNGTYQFIITYWNGTEVGLNISTFVKVYTPTSLNIVSETTELTVESAYNLTLSFWDIAKDTGINGSNVNVTIDPDWTNAYKQVPNNGTAGFFSVSIPTTGQVEGLYTIMIYANAFYHINQTDSRKSNFVGLIDTELSPPHYPTNIYYTDTFRLWITFNESESTNPIANATVVVTCSSMGIDNKAMSYNESGFYYLDIQTTGNDTINHNFNITARKTSYQPQTQLFSIGILENPTNLIGADSSGPIINGSMIISIYYNESYLVEFQYNDTQHDITIDETPTVQFSAGSPLPYVTGTDGENKTVLFTLNETGQHKVLISFAPALGYNPQIFNLTLDISPIQTSTQGQNGAQNVVFGTSYTFWIRYWDDFNSKGIAGVNPAIEGPAAFDSDDGAGNYTFIFDISLTQIETYSVNITFSKTGYVTQAIELKFTVIPRDTSIVSISEPYNESTVYLVYGNAYTISLNVTDEENSTVMDYLIEDNFTLTNIDWDGFLTFYDFIFSATTLGQTQVTIQLAVYGFENSSWRVTFEVAHVPTNFTSAQLSGNQTVNLVFEQGYYFNVSIGDENHSTWITDITPDNTQPGIPYLYFLGIVDNYYSFLFNYSYIKLGSFEVNVTWIKTGYQTQHLVLVFEIAPRDTHIASTSGALNESSVHLIYGNAYTITLTITDQENGTQMNYLIAENFSLVHINLDEGTTYNFTFLSMTLGETQVKIQLTIYGFVNHSWVVIFSVAPVPTDLTGTINDGTPITNESSILVYYKNSFGLNLTWTDTNHSLGVSTILTTETVNSTAIPTLWITNLYPDSGSYDYHIFPYDDDYLGFWIITVILEKYGYLNKTWILYVQVEARPTLLSASLANGTAFTNDSVLHFLIEENITFHLDWTDVNSSTSISSPTVVPTSNPIGALTQLYDFDFKVSSSSEGILPRSVTVTITYSKDGYVSQIYYIVFVVHGRATSIVGQTSGNIDLFYGESYIFWIVYNDTTESRSINNATVEISGYITFLGGNNTGNYTFLFNHSLIEVGSFSVTISLSRSGYDKQEVNLDFEVFERPTVLLASIHNGTLITLDYQNNTDVWVALNDTRTRSLIRIENVLDFTIAGSIGFNLSFYDLTYGSNITLNLLAYDLGNFNITLEVHKYGYVQQAIGFSLIVTSLETTEPIVLGSSGSTILADYNFSVLYWWVDTYDRNISDAIVSVYLNGTKLNETEKEFWIERIPLYDYYNITVNTTSLDAGNYNITYSFSKYGYQTSLVETQLILLAHMIDVTINYPNSVNIGDELTILIQIADLNTTTAPEQVDMTTDWDYRWTFDNNLSATGNYSLILSTIGTTPREQSVLIYYTGFQIQSGNISITFNSLGSFSISGLKDESQYINETQVFTFSIKDQTDTFHSDLAVWWELVGTTKAGNATNLGNGQYEVEVNCSSLEVGQTYTLKISAEKNYYVPLLNQTTLKILAKDVTILDWVWKELPSSFTQGEDFVLEVQLLFVNGTPVAGEIVNFTIIIQYKDKSSVPTKRSPFNMYGQQYSLFFIMSLDAENTLTLNMSDRTDDNGVARVIINETRTKNAIGLESVHVFYLGSKGYTDSSLILDVSIAILPPQGDGDGVNPMWIIVAAVMAAIFVLSGAIYIRRREKKQELISRKKLHAYQELIEITGMRHLFISTTDGVGIYSETFFQQVTSETSPMLAGLITALDSFVQEFSKEEAEFSQLKRGNFAMISRRGKYTQITLISECTATEITKKRLRETQNTLETKYEDVLKFPMIDLSRMPIEDLSAICKQHLHTNLLYGLTVDEEQMVTQWKGLNKLERKAVQAARRSIQLTDHSTLHLNSWVSEMRLLGVDESKILKGIFAVMDRKIVHIKVETGI